MANQVTLGNGDVAYLRHPKLNGDSVHLAGTDSAHKPVIHVSDGVNNDWDSIVVQGNADHPAFGQVVLGPDNPGNVTLDNGIYESYGNLTLGSGTNGSYTLNGDSYIVNDSTLIVNGGRYHTSPLIVNGHLNVDSGSTANFDNVTLKGTGSIGVEGGATLNVDQVVAGLYAYVGRAGNLVIDDGMKFQGTIVEDNLANIDVLNAGSAVSEVLHQSLSGQSTTMDLLNQHGGTVAELKFLHEPNIYASPDGHGGMNIINQPLFHDLPITFAH